MPIKLDGSTGVITSTSSLTTGSVLFAGAGGGAIQDNANFFWDDTNNRLGIGNTSPAYALDVTGAINSTISGKSAQFNAAGASIYASFADGTNTWRIGNGIISAGVFSLYNLTGAVQAFNIDASGNLGLGVTPSAWASVTALQLAGSGFIASNNQYLEISTNTYYNAGYKYIGTGLATDYSQQAGKHIWFTAPSGTANAAITFTQAMTLDASGRLGIVETSPSATLHVKSSNNAGLFRAATDTFACWLNVRNGTQQAVFGTEGSTGGSIATNTSAYATIINDVAGYGVQFATSNTLRATIDASGNLLVGTTSATFTYQTGLTTTAKTAISDSGFDILNLISTGNNPVLSFSQPNSASTIFRYANIRGIMTTTTAGSEAGALTFSTSTGGLNSAERARIDASGNLLVTGSSGGLGYGTGSGGTATQGSSSGKGTGVTLNKIVAQITMNNAALAANTEVGFVITNSFVTTNDNVIISLVNSGTASMANYNIRAAITTGGIIVYLKNISGGSLSDAVVFNFTVIKGAIS